jgi:hypothetical protein
VCAGPSAGLWAEPVRPDIRIARPVREYRDPLVVPYEPDGQVLSYRVSACPETAFPLAIRRPVLEPRSRFRPRSRHVAGCSVREMVRDSNLSMLEDRTRYGQSHTRTPSGNGQRSVKVDSNALQSQWFTPAIEDWKSRVHRSRPLRPGRVRTARWLDRPAPARAGLVPNSNPSSDTPDSDTPDPIRDKIRVRRPPPPGADRDGSPKARAALQADARPHGVLWRLRLADGVHSRRLGAGAQTGQSDPQLNLHRPSRRASSSARWPRSCRASWLSSRWMVSRPHSGWWPARRHCSGASEPKRVSVCCR